MKEFYCATRIVSGSGAVAALKELGCRKLLVVSDPYFNTNGKALELGAISGAQQVEIFADVMPDPTVELVARGTALVKTFEPDTVVALGGGSAMDCAKAMLFFSGVKAQFVAIPTTSGSGSEVTDFAVLTHQNVKHPLVDRRLVPDVAILDDELLRQLPPKLVADAGFDVLSHALEAYVANNATLFTDALAKEAFCKAGTLLPASFAGVQEVRLEMHICACMAGVAFNRAGLGLCHAMSHVLGGISHISHGSLNAILLPAVVGANAQKAAGKYADIARAAGMGGSAETMAVRGLRSALCRLRRELNMPGDLAQAGIEVADIRENEQRIVEAVLADPCCVTNPVAVDGALVRSVLHEVMGRG